MSETVPSGGENVGRILKNGQEGMKENDEMASMSYILETGLIGIDVPCWNEMRNKLDFFFSSCCISKLNWIINLILKFPEKEIS